MAADWRAERQGLSGGRGFEMAEDGLPVPRRHWAAGAIFLTLFMVMLDTSIANIALPTIALDVRATPADSIWVVNAYQIGIVMILLPVGALAEIVGYRRVYTLGLAIFVAASLGCAMSRNLPALALARFVQGFGAASIYGVNAALVRFTYPRALLARGMAKNTTTVAIAAAVGPTVAAAILAIASWRWLFAVNVPIGLLALAVGARALPRAPTVAVPFDLRSAALNALTFSVGFLALDDIVHGMRSFRTAAMALIAATAGLALVRRSHGRERPLVPLDLLRIGILRLSYATSSFSFGAQTALMVALPFYLQYRFGFDHVLIGLLITPMPLGIAAASLFIHALIDRVEAGLLGGIGLIILALAISLLAWLPSGAGALAIAATMAVAGFGFGLFQTPNNRTMLSMAPTHRSGAAAGMLATARLVGQMGGALAVSILFGYAGPASIIPLLFVVALAGWGALFSLRQLAA